LQIDAAGIADHTGCGIADRHHTGCSGLLRRRHQLALACGLQAIKLGQFQMHWPRRRNISPAGARPFLGPRPWWALLCAVCSSTVMILCRRSARYLLPGCQRLQLNALQLNASS
jgi:hypothetical protein